MKMKKRKWWLAGLLSLFYPGLGQIYNGQAAKGILFIALPFSFVPVLLFFLEQEKILVLLVLLGSGIVIYYLAALGDAVCAALRSGGQYALKKYNKWYVYLGIVVLAFFLNNAINGYVKNHWRQAFKIPSTSNAPTLLVGDHILVDRTKAARNPNQGDLVVFEFPEDPSKMFIKRVVAIGGDTVEIKNKELFVNNEKVTEPYVIHKDTKTKPARDFYGPVVVPENTCFVMGDNRDHSYDSRFFGFVDLEKIQGAAKFIYWSWDNENHSVRWNRIGLRVYQFP